MPVSASTGKGGARPSAPFYHSFGFRILIATVLALVLGLIAKAMGPLADGSANGLTVALETIGSIFVQLLKVIVPPLVFTAIVASIATIGEMRNAARLVWQSLLWFAITALIAVSIGTLLGLLLQPGLHAGGDGVAHARPVTSGGWFDFLKGLVPANIFALEIKSRLTDGVVTSSPAFNTLQLVILSITIGIAALKTGEAAQPFLAFNKSLLAIVRRVLRWLIALTPIGTVGLLGNAVAQYGWDTLGQLGGFALTVYLGLALVLLVVYPALLVAHGLNPFSFFRHAWPAIQVGFVTRSSIGTLPVTEEVTERLGVPHSYAAFIVPLGATTKMDGCAAIYPAVAALFIAQFYQIPLGLADYGLIAFVSVLGSAATAGLTGAIVMLTLTLSTLGLPLEGVGLLLAIDPIIDMGRTAINVAGQALVPTIVSKREGILDEAAYADYGVTAPEAEAR